jgi:hypothetical protein
MKMLLKSNKGSGKFPPLQNIINDKKLEDSPMMTRKNVIY